MSAALAPERERELVERLHAGWHPAGGGCPRPDCCDELRRARGAVDRLGPVVAEWIARAVNEATDAVDSAWGERALRRYQGEAIS